MDRFSFREGIQSLRTEFQVKSMDHRLRNGLWNQVIVHYWEGGIQGDLDRGDNRRLKPIIRDLWDEFLGRPLDTIPQQFGGAVREIRSGYFELDWYEVYDFIEFIAARVPDYGDYENGYADFMKQCNTILEREMSAYRFVAGRITPITSEVEIGEIEAATDAARPLAGVHTHLTTALARFSDRESPDYRNSIKESILAVEGMCRLVSKKRKASLGDALGTIERGAKMKLHGALKEAFDKLYGYTSDAEGVRHAHMVFIT